MPERRYRYPSTSTVCSRRLNNACTRVVDLHSPNANPDPDSAFFLIADPDSDLDNNADPDPFPDPVLWWQKIGKSLHLEIFYIYFFDQKLQFTYLKLQEKPSTLKREHPALRNMKILYFCLFWGNISPPESRTSNSKLMRIRIRMRIHNPGLYVRRWWKANQGNGPDP